mgnify:CR=1 FL=1
MAGHVFLTGVTGGIGSAIAQCARRAGLGVVGFDQRVPNEDPLLYELDVADSSAVHEVFHAAVDAHGKPLHLIIAAGVMTLGYLDSLGADEFRKALEVNTLGVFNALQAGLSLLDTTGTPSVVVVTSNAAKVPRAGLGAYCASKAAAEAIARVAGLEYSSRGVRVNCVAPGSTRTKMLYETVGQLTDDQIIDGNPRDFRLGIPLTRIAEPEDIARVVMFLTSESARNITMQSFTVDGGATLGVQ